MSYQQVTLATLRARLSDRFDAVPFWSAEESRRALNEGLRVFSAATGFWREPLLLQTVPNDPYVALSNSMVQGTRVQWNDLPLEPASLFDLDYSIPNWRGATTASGGAHPSRPVYWARISLTQLAIYPADAYNTVGGTHSLLINGVRNTPVLTLDTDWVDLGQEQLDVLLGYALHVLAFKLGGQALIATYPGWLAFLTAAGRESKEFAATAFYRSVMGLDQQRRLMPPEKAVATLADAQVVLDQSGGA